MVVVVVCHVYSMDKGRCRFVVWEWKDRKKIGRPSRDKKSPTNGFEALLRVLVQIQYHSTCIVHVWVTTPSAQSKTL